MRTRAKLFVKSLIYSYKTPFSAFVFPQKTTYLWQKFRHFWRPSGLSVFVFAVLPVPHIYTLGAAPCKGGKRTAGQSFPGRLVIPMFNTERKKI